MQHYIAAHAPVLLDSMINHVAHRRSVFHRIPALIVVLLLLSGLAFSVRGQGRGFRTQNRVDREGISRVLSGLAQEAKGSTPLEAASEFLRSRHRALRLDGVSLDTDHAGVLRSAYGSRITIAQTLDGIPVFRGGMVIAASPDNEIRMLVNDVIYGVNLQDRRPEISADDAVALARRHLLASGSTIGLPSTTLFVFRTPGGSDHLAYRVTATLTEPYGDWEVFVDARSGEILSVRDLFVNADTTEYVQGLAAVFRSDPLSELNGIYGSPGLVDNNDADSQPLNAARVVVVLDSLRLQNGQVTLAGPFCTVTDIEAPADPMSYTEYSPDAFLYTRSQPGFEAAMVYYHATSAFQRIQELGFAIPRLRTLRLDPHGYQGQDNSHYSPSGNWISFGTGGVDDAEDADVIWHEYGHAIVYGLIPYWGGGEAGALGEGYSDYWAASHSRSLGQWQSYQPQYQWIFRWDGHNTFWPGRILNDPGTYPFGSLSIHAAGQIWASALMGIHDDLGRDVTDRLVLQSLFYLGSSPTAHDAALAILQADRDLYGGTHQAILVYWLGTVKKFLPEDEGVPILVIADDTVVPADTHRVALTGQQSVIPIQPGHLPFSSTLATLALPAGYTFRSTSFDDLDSTALAESPLVVLVGGQNPRPFDDDVKRAAIVRYVAGGGKVIVEGGEVGFVYAARQEGELDVEFRRSVLHLGEYGGDILGAAFLPDFSSTSIFSTPHAISSTLAFQEPASFAQRDLDLPDLTDPNTTVIGNWSGEDRRGGILLHCSPGGGASLLVPFSLASLQDSLQASWLMENILTGMILGTLPTTSVTDGEFVPTSFVLHQNYPNPFNPATTIRFELGGNDAEYDITIDVFDELGRLVATPVRGTHARGVHEVNFEASTLPSGAYFYRLSSAEHRGEASTTLVRRMLLLR